MLTTCVGFLTIGIVSAVVYNQRDRPDIPEIPVRRVGYCNPNWRPVPCPRIALFHRCDRNEDCRPRQKCCKDDCGNRVCRSRDISLPVRNCPNWRKNAICAAVLRPDECTSNLDCGKGKFCCLSSCGQRVCRSKDIPVPVKKCPNWRPNLVCAAIFRPDECTSNLDCGKRRFCCLSSCGQRVCRSKDISVPVKKCPNWRPNVACTAILRRDECKSNLDCGKGRFCCLSSCGQRVCRSKDISVPVKKCPNWRPNVACTAIFRPDECKSSVDCGKGRFCCLSICGQRVCRNRDISLPVKKCPNARPDLICTAIHRPHQCSSNLDCGRGRFCCLTSCGQRVCRRNTIPVPACRSNSRRPPICPLIIPIHECSTNIDCGIGRTCCRNECGKNICQGDRIPRCPRTDIFPIRNRVCHGRDRCHRNLDCRRGEICCKNFCNYNVCRRRVNEKPGECPISLGVDRRLCFNTSRPRRRRCSNDFDCPGNRKCCSDICGDRICSIPIRK